MIDISKEIAAIKHFVQTNLWNVYCATSGGKDSAVIMYLTYQVYPECLCIHNPKDETDPRTVQMLYEYGKKYRILHCHGRSMEDIITRLGFTGQIDGTKKCEWNRQGKSTDVIIDGESVGRENMNQLIVHRGIWGIQNLYPILDWSDDKVFEFCKERDIPLSGEYDII